MIEMVYSGKESDGQAEIKLPKNIRQIGENKSGKKVYVEDYVMTQLKKKPENEESVKYGVLLGEIKKSKGNSYIFVKGMVEVRDVIENSLIFNDEIWSGIYKDVKRYFEGLEIVGWFVSVPYRVRDDMSGIKKIHLDNFAGSDKVCFLSDRTEKEDGFFAYEKGELSKQSGYYIYYEKNERMKKYLKEKSIAKKKASDTENNSEQKNEAKQKQSKSENDNIVMINPLETEKTQSEKKAQTLRDVINSRSSENEEPKMGKIAYGISGLLIVALLLSTIVMMNNYGELKNIKQSLQNMSDGQNVQAVNKIIESLTTGPAGEHQSGKDAAIKESKNGNNTKNKTTQAWQNSETNTQNNKMITSNQQQNSTVQNAETKSNAQTGNSKNIGQTRESSNNSQSNDSRDTAGGIYSGMYHTVVAGQTLYDISMKYYGTSSMVEKIKELNGIDEDYTIIEGQKIKLP